MGTIKNILKQTPILGTLAIKTSDFLRNTSTFKSSGDYWISRYAKGGNSGAGSYDKFAEFKAEIINRFVTENAVETAIEFGCGDGNQLAYLHITNFIGFDISPEALQQCKNKFENDTTKSFFLMKDYAGQTADLTLSLDVIFHLVEDDVFTDYMEKLFHASNKYVIIYSSNTEKIHARHIAHVRHRKFTDWVEANHPECTLLEIIPNKYPHTGDPTEGSFADFYIYSKL